MNGKVKDYKLIVRLVLDASFGPEDVTAVDHLGGTAIERVVDEDLMRFNDFFAEELKNGSLTGPERAVVKTYLGWKLGVFQHRG